MFLASLVELHSYVPKPTSKQETYKTMLTCEEIIDHRMLKVSKSNILKHTSIKDLAIYLSMARVVPHNSRHSDTRMTLPRGNKPASLK